MIADAATGVEDFDSLKQIQTVIRPPSYPLLCQFLMKITIVTNLVFSCVKISAEGDDFQNLSKGERGERERERERAREREREREFFYNFELLKCYVCTIQLLVVLYYEIKRQL